jgi:hypothetical protein
MASPLAKKAAGTFIQDSADKLPPTLAWATFEARQGTLQRTVQQFCAAQPELLNPALVLVEKLSADCMHCCIPCRCADHESPSTFPVDVRFRLNPRTRECWRD